MGIDSPSHADLAARIVGHDIRAVARGLRILDDRAPGHEALSKALHPHTGRAFVLGVTGNPGAGKSTLTDRLIEHYRKAGKIVAVLAIDPSSPYSGGAILGDRIRMNRHSTDEGVFIRSVATRGHLGGLSRSARDMIRAFDAWGADVVIVETVGVGQDELEITRTAHTTLVVLAPGMGDEVQAIKAGLMETADVFAVNKADRDGADSTMRDVELMIALGRESIIALGKSRGHVVHGASAAEEHAAHVRSEKTETWTPPIVKCVANRGTGIAELAEKIEQHRVWIDGTEAGRARRRVRIADELRQELREALIEAAMQELGGELDAAVARVEARELDPYAAIDDLVTRFRARR
jgi:LAO/AO transport system kinase